MARARSKSSPKKNGPQTHSATAPSKLRSRSTKPAPGFRIPSNNPLLSYLRKLSPDSRERFAARVGTNPVYLHQLATSWRGRKISHEMAVKIERASWGLVRCESILPSSIWDYLRWRPKPSEPYQREQADAFGSL